LLIKRLALLESSHEFLSRHWWYSELDTIFRRCAFHLPFPSTKTLQSSPESQTSHFQLPNKDLTCEIDYILFASTFVVTLRVTAEFPPETTQENLPNSKIAAITSLRWQQA
jgi:hypothetical protein